MWHSVSVPVSALCDNRSSKNVKIAKRIKNLKIQETLVAVFSQTVLIYNFTDSLKFRTRENQTLHTKIYLDQITLDVYFLQLQKTVIFNHLFRCFSVPELCLYVVYFSPVKHTLTKTYSG